MGDVIKSMKINFLSVIFFASTCGFCAEHYRSAGVVPIIRESPEFEYSCALFRTDHKPMEPGLANPVSCPYEFSDLGAKREPGETDSACTAARAFFDFQRKFKNLDQLTAFIAQSIKIDSQDGHITYFVPFKGSELVLPPSRWLLMLHDLIELRTLDAFPGKYLAHDDTGCFMVLSKRFAEGLKRGDNLAKLKNIR